MHKVLAYFKEAAAYPPPAFVNGQGAENFGLGHNKIAIVLDNAGITPMSEYCKFTKPGESVAERPEALIKLRKSAG
ncbi:hypothetical protein [Paenibacillus sp. J2TS4]|uniref:hypothetical protein n=1 Tax=Paenibacillus sp. J2TS4 TaxID=2807194 RepID=UPI001B016AF0|nr:hypothetical protein [Paenibacillus sp. J2TS4]GIP34815.1 hypothetical protein J2TS4_40250 [Paenibacillus sp. J2TS4]